MKQKEKAQYFITIVITLVSMVVMLTYNFTTFYANAVSNMIALGKSSLAEETEQLNSYLSKGMDIMQVTAITMEYMISQGADSEEIERYLIEESKRYTEDIDPNFTGIYGWIQGEYIDGIGWVPDEDYVPKEREWYIAAVEAGGKPTVVSPYLDAQTNTVMVSVSQLLKDGDSVISFDIVLDEVQVITQNINLDNKGYGFVVDREGLVVAHSAEEEKGKNYQVNEEMNALLDRVYKDQEETFNTSISGESCTVFADKVMDDWYVVMIVSNTKLYHDIRGILIRNIILCVGVFILIASFCTLAFRKIGIHMRSAEESRRNVEIMNKTIMKTLARTIDAKDRYTNGHSQRVARYALEIARRMGKSREEQEKIYNAALLHDVGKIHIPDSIINKAARLTDEEFAHIKLHPVSGYHILRDISGNDMIPKGARWHHERYDGNGYPNGLVGESIPEVARIIGVADAYDAMTSNRSYRQIMPQEKVRSEIEKGRGLQFDPDVADVMLQMIDEDTEYMMRQTNLTINILVVESNKEDLEQIEFILKDEPGYTILKETTGEGALECMKGQQIDIVILDMQLSDMDGFELWGKFKQISDIPVIFIMSNKSMDIIEKADSMGIDDYLTKPFMPQTLLEMLHGILQDKEL